ncbi:MAG: GNAT family N-acetyltransferase [Flavobacteriaceae bacterium]
MSKEIIFETERLLIRKLVMSDLTPFHTMESNPRVLQYATGDVKSLEANEKELEELIEKYSLEGNDFWIYAIERKSDEVFIGTVALVKDGEDDEIGYRFLEIYWGLGYGFEICKGLITYCKSIGMPKIIGYIIDANTASSKILEKCNFKVVEKGIDPTSKLPETKYELKL